MRSSELKVVNWAAVPDPAMTEIDFSMNFHVPGNFGTVGAIIIHNRHTFEFLLVSFSLALPERRTVIHFPCNSWVYNTSHKPGRIFFSNKVHRN